MKRIALTLALASSIAASAFGQPRQAVMRISPFTGSGVGSSEASMLERLVASYIVELKSFKVIDAQGQEMALSETEAALSLGSTASASAPLTADYIVGGAIGKIGDIFVLTLDATKVSSGEKISVSDTAHSISDIVLRARGLTRSLFGRPDQPAAAGLSSPGIAAAPDAGATATTQAGQAAAPSDRVAKTAIALSDIVGTWRGDKGLETVRIFPNATGLAVLSGGGTLKLRVALAGDSIEIAQDQPNDMYMYRAASVTADMARRIAAQARPMRWIFELALDAQTLYGTKESISISGSGASMRVDNDYVREASWTRISR
ncbi:MAG: hypothetical protein KKA67_13620 [Spirochaetes bacterium]|nr:hypothetical protein [Spirochaetota bacterium]